VPAAGFFKGRSQSDSHGFAVYAGRVAMISTEDRKILNEFTNRVRERFSDAPVWAFGSRARGKAAWESDFDLLIVLSDVNQKTDRWTRDIAWEVGFKNDRVITTILLDKEQFEDGPMSERKPMSWGFRHSFSDC
jgi:predicted nucleotidyltransferase